MLLSNSRLIKNAETTKTEVGEFFIFNKYFSL